MNSYKDLEIYQMGLNLFFSIHPKSLLLPKYELYELGSQLRRSSDSIPTNIVEGYGRRRYKSEFIRFLVMAHGSCLETYFHLEKIIYLYPKLSNDFIRFKEDYDQLGAKIYSFIKYVENNWKT